MSEKNERKSQKQQSRQSKTSQSLRPSKTTKVKKLTNVEHVHGDVYITMQSENDKTSEFAQPTKLDQKPEKINNASKDVKGLMDSCSTVKELEGLERYMKKVKNKYDSIPTILYREFLSPFSDYYVPNDVTMRIKIPAKNGKKAEDKIKRISSVTLEDILAISKSIILSGGGGFGKSMMLRNLLLSCVDEYEDRGLIPFFILVKDYEKQYKNLVDYIYATIRNFWPKIKKDTLKAIFEEGKALLLFDGLDEINMENFSIFNRQFNDFYMMYSENFFVISSRPYSNFQSFIKFKLIELQPFTKAQALNLIDRFNYFSDMPKMQERFRKLLENKLYDTHKGFSDNPLLLSIMLLIFKSNADVPTIRYEFYQEAYNVLAIRHDANKDLIRQLRTGCTANEFSKLFAAFCSLTYGEDKVSSFTISEMGKYFDILKDSFNLKNITVDDFAFDATNNLCLMYKDGWDYNFIHRSFQEYFCAKFLHGLLDEELENFIPMFDKFNITKKDDMTLPMLFDMKAEAVEKYMIVPYLQKLIDFCENKDGIWTFLEKIYPYYEISDDTTSNVVGEARSNLYSFIMRHYAIPVVYIVPDDFPGIENWINPVKYSEGASFLEECYFKDEYSKYSALYKVSWAKIKKFGDKELVEAIESDTNSFMVEYQNIKDLLNAIRNKRTNQNREISLAIQKQLIKKKI